MHSCRPGLWVEHGAVSTRFGKVEVKGVCGGMSFTFRSAVRDPWDYAQGTPFEALLRKNVRAKFPAWERPEDIACR